MVLPEEALGDDLVRLEARHQGRSLVWTPKGCDFLTNDVLDLSRDPSVVEAGVLALEEHGAGARASRLLGGHATCHEAAERAAADWLGTEEALLFPSGWQAASGVLSALAARGDALLCDELLHASLIDGARLSRARRLVHGHLDLGALERGLCSARGARRRLIVTEGIFSMDGTAPDLCAIHDLAERHDAWVVLDEAHSAGVLGPKGRGAWAAAGLPTTRLAARIVTGGKALGVAGAFVLGSARLKQVLLAKARAFVFTTGAPPALAGSLRAAIARAQTMDDERAHILALARRLALALGLPEPAGAIVPVPVGESESALCLARVLREQGHELSAVRPPTVPEGTSRLRIVVRASHRLEDVERLADAILASGWSRPAPILPQQRARTLWVVGTDTSVGKTVVAAALVPALRERGPVSYWKPVQTGPDSDTLEVARLVRGLEPSPPAVCLPLPASPHEAATAAHTRIDPLSLDRALDQRLRELGHGTLIVEPAGGLMVPLTDTFLTADWLAARGEALVLVARSSLGTLNHTLLTLEALAARALVPSALVLVGDRHPSNARTLAAAAPCTVFELPFLEPLDAAALANWALDSGLLGVLP